MSITQTGLMLPVQEKATASAVYTHVPVKGRRGKRHAEITSIPASTRKCRKTASEPHLTGIKSHHQSTEEIQKSPKATETFFLYQNVLEYDNQQLEYTIEDHDITLRIPEKAVPEGKKIHFEIGVAAYGPFNFPKNTRPVSPIVWLSILEKEIELQKPFQIVLPHYLTGLTKERMCYHQVKFVKGINKNDTSDEQGHMYKFDFCDSDPLFASNGDKSYGILESTHCCFYCLEAEETQELANESGYCLTRIERRSSAQPKKTEVYFIATYFLKTCIKALTEQFPPKDGYRTSRHDQFKFKEGCLVFATSNSWPSDSWPSDLECTVGFEPTAAEIDRADINFWNSSYEEMKLKHETKIYPPRVKMTVRTSDPQRPFIIPVEVGGCLSAKKVNMDITFPIENIEAFSVPGFENRSQTIHTYDSKPSLRDAFRELLNIASDWKSIGILLGLGAELLQTIENEYDAVRDRLSKMLMEWLEQVDPRPTWRRLIDAVKMFDSTKAQEIRQHIATQQ